MTINHISHLLESLNVILHEQQSILCDLNKKITFDTDYWITRDHTFARNYIKSYLKYNSEFFFKPYKPKGEVLLILSYNEPFILSIIPVLNALIAGNSVFVKPSSRNINFFKKIWFESGLVNKFNLKLYCIEPANREELKEHIVGKQAVYFFGGYNVAQNIFKTCAKHFVEFFPEIETADCKIINFKEPKREDLHRQIITLFEESFSHAGQTCQRIQGVYINQEHYDFLKNILISEYNNYSVHKKFNQHITQEFLSNIKSLDFLNLDISQAQPEELISNSQQLPYLIFNPHFQSNLVKNAYFLPIMWVIPYTTITQLTEMLASRRFRLGLNIMSDSREFIEHLIRESNFSRYTVNRNHIDIDVQEGWGGMWPSGFSGYKNWLAHFSNPYTLIR